MEAPRYIVIEGPIGVGKTSLAKLLAEELRARCIFEKVDENPFLGKFYQDRAKHAFQTQIFFLLSRFQQQKLIGQGDLFQRVTLADYLFAKDRIFAHLNLDENELSLYEQIYRLLDARIVKPDLVVYLQARPEVLMQRIRKRGVDFERNITAPYLEELTRAYNEFFFQYSETPLLVVHTSEIDFVERREDFDNLVREIRRMRGGTQYYQPIGSR